MTKQIDFFTSTDTIEPPTGPAVEEQPVVDKDRGKPIAVPCGFRDRGNNSCWRLGTWPVVANGRQMVCRGRPMLHCDLACFNGEAITPSDREADGDIVWKDRDGYHEAAE